MIVGPNEAGKSTLLQAIQAMLYGFFKDSGAWAGEAARLRYQPWSGQPYDGTLYLRLSNGDMYQIERRFSPERTTIYRNPGATDVTSTFGPTSHGWVDFADRTLGLSPSVFRASACIHQSELHLEGTNVRALHAKLETLADSGGTEQSAHEATALLDRWLRERVNPNAHIVEYSPRKRAELLVDSLRVELTKSQGTLDELAGLVIEQKHAAEVVASRQCELNWLEGLIAWSEARSIEAKIRQLADADRAIAEARTGLTGLADVALVTESMLDAAGDAASKATRLGAEAKQAADSLQDARCRQVDWRTSLDPRLTGRTAVNLDELRRAVRDAEIRRDDHATAQERASDQAADPGATGEFAALEARLGDLNPESLETVRALETDLKVAAARGASGGQLSRPPIVGVAVVLGLIAGYTLGGFAGAVVGATALGALAFVGLGQLRGGFKDTGDPEIHAGLAERLQPYGVESVAELQRLWDRRSALRDRLSDELRLRRNAGYARASFDRAIGEIDRLIGIRDVDEAGQILELLEAWTSRGAALEREERLAVAKNESARQSWEGSLAKARTALEGLGVAFDGAHDQPGPPGGDSDASNWPRDLATCRDRFETYQKYRHTLDVHLAGRRALVGLDDPTTWPARAEELRGRAIRPDDGDTRTLTERRELKERWSAELTKARNQAIRLATQLEEKSAAVTDPAELEEHLAEADAKLTQIKRLDAGLQGARDLIRQVAEEQRRNFAPHLEQSLSAWIDRATDHRYSDAKVSPRDLSVRLTSTEAGRLVTLDQVSHGTRDAVALLLRASVVDLLSASTERVPLFLDDPLVHVDPSRAQRVLGLLVELAAQRQIFYFTQDPRVEAWVGSPDAGQIHRLERPVPARRS